MPDYKNAKIYLLTDGNLNYYGSTCNALCRRYAGHIQHYKKYIDGKKNWYSAIEILKNPNHSIQLIENFPCNNKDELHKRERFFIDNNECINKNKPTQTEIERNKQQKYKDYKHKWYFENKDRINKKSIEKYKENADKLKQYQKEYRSNPDNLLKIKKRKSQKESCPHCFKNLSHQYIKKHINIFHNNV